MTKKKHMAGRPRRGSTVRRDAIEGIELELISLIMNVDEVSTRLSQALRRTPLVVDVLGPALERTIEMRSSLDEIKAQFDSAWQSEVDRWSH